MTTKMNKDVIIGVLVFFVVIFGYYAIFNNEKETSPEETTEVATENKSENYFAQNKDCLKYKAEIAKRLETKKSPFGEASLEQIFFSPKRNSCLYVEYASVEGDLLKGELFSSRRLFDILDDGPSSHPLVDCYTERIGEAWKCANFDEKVEEYKQ